MTVYQILSCFGIPAIFSGIVMLLIKHYLEKTQLHSKETEKRLAETEAKSQAAMLGIQALLRAQMISDYNHYREKGFAPIYARDNFENCWKHYHSLGANGVMDDIHEKFLKLPTDESED